MVVCLKCWFPFPVRSVCLIRVVIDVYKFVYPVFLGHSGYSNTVAAMCGLPAWKFYRRFPPLPPSLPCWIETFSCKLKNNNKKLTKESFWDNQRACTLCSLPGGALPAVSCSFVLSLEQGAHALLYQTSGREAKGWLVSLPSFPVPELELACLSYYK